MARLTQVLWGVQHVRVEQGYQRRYRQLLMVTDMEIQRRSWQQEPGGRDSLLLWAAATLAFSGIVRSGELALPMLRVFDPAIYITWRDIMTDCPIAPSRIMLTLRASKTNQGSRVSR